MSELDLSGRALHTANLLAGQELLFGSNGFIKPGLQLPDAGGHPYQASLRMTLGRLGCSITAAGIGLTRRTGGLAEAGFAGVMI